MFEKFAQLVCRFGDALTSEGRFLYLVAEIVKDFVESDSDNSAGGALHIVLSDGNLDADSIIWCMGEAGKANDEYAEAVAYLLLMLSEKQRDKLYEMHLC